MRRFVEAPYLALSGGATKFLKLIFRSYLRPRTGPLTIANGLSISRVVFFGPLGFWMMANEYHFLAVITVFISGSLTDLLDGAAAREEGSSTLGEAIDPWCDKIYLTWYVLPFFSYIWYPLNWILLISEAAFFFAAIVALLLGWKDDVKSEIWGKTRFTTQCMAAGMLIIGFHETGNVLIFIATLLIGPTVWDKVRRVWRKNRVN